MKKKYSVATALLLSTTLLIGGGSIAQADDDYEKYEEDGYYEEEYEQPYREDRYEEDYDYEKDDYYEEDNYYEGDYYEEDNDYEDDYYEGGGGYYDNTSATPQYETKIVETVVAPDATWNVWKKSTNVTQAPLPLKKATTVKLTVAKNTIDLYVIPQDGELFVPAKKIAEALGANATFFKTSRILYTTKGNTELIFRAGTNVAYEGTTKTPLPAKTFFTNEDIYVPISAVMNGLGFAVEYAEKTNTFTAKSL